jgi:hypothetical protein
MMKSFMGSRLTDTEGFANLRPAEPFTPSLDYKIT